MEQLTKRVWTFSDLSLVIREEEVEKESFWVVQCLEYDIAAQGEDLRGAIECWQSAFMAQAMANIEAGNSPMENVPVAPSEYRRLYNEAIPLALPVDIVGPKHDAPPPCIIKAEGQTRLAA